MPTGTLILNRSDVRSLLTQDTCIAAVEHAFRELGQGTAGPPGILGIHVEGGGFHIKTGVLPFGNTYFVAKTNANFPNNRHVGLPTIQGVILVCDARSGRVLALMDSIEVTILRTGAATALAAKYLSRAEARTATIIGCGNQGRISARMLSRVRDLATVYLYDIDADRARGLANELSPQKGTAFRAVTDWRDAAASSDILITATPATEPFLSQEHVSPGTFIAAVGSDSEAKNELDPALVAGSTVIADLRQQAAAIGEVHHAITHGRMAVRDVYAELGEIVAGRKAVPDLKRSVVIFDSTGIGLQDVAAASIVYENALAAAAGLVFDFQG